MMLVHTWVDQYVEGGGINTDWFSRALAQAVQFDCGPIDEIPIGKATEFCQARSPFPTTVLQFETSPTDGRTHILVVWEESSDGGVLLMVAQRLLNKYWNTLAPTRITFSHGVFHFERYGLVGNGPADVFVKMMFAHALNFFYILGCANVEVVDIPAPRKLNQKREKSGRYPLLEYKTLALKLDAKHTSRPAAGGTHASPRVHLRRGHVRQLESGRRIWVQACVVGAKEGVIVKDYRWDGAGAAKPAADGL